MTRDEIVRAMRSVCDKDKVDAWQCDFWTITQEELERFAALVAAHEREECALECDEYAYADEAAAAIRARVPGILPRGTGNQ